MALERKRICHVLQPQVDCDGNAYGAEALVRWSILTGDFLHHRNL